MIDRFSTGMRLPLRFAAHSVFLRYNVSGRYRWGRNASVLFGMNLCDVFGSIKDNGSAIAFLRQMTCSFCSKAMQVTSDSSGRRSLWCCFMPQYRKELSVRKATWFDGVGQSFTRLCSSRCATAEAVYVNQRHH
ncbi:hypothetical protein D918_05547 [Trichuris suis]|nr:hypothetical protein D918_05547 [Trichuris suis]